MGDTVAQKPDDSTVCYLFYRYFETFDTLSGSSFKKHTSWNKSFAQCRTMEEIGRYTYYY